MNTKPTLKRFTPPPMRERDGPAQTFKVGLHEPRFASAFALMASYFVHLEGQMKHVLAVLLGMSDPKLAGYILRALKAPNTRADVMKELLELAPSNASLGDEYDHFIREFRRISIERNQWVHAEWWTGADNTVWASRQDKHGVGLLTMRKVRLQELFDVINAINDLERRVLMGPGRDLNLQRLAHGRAQRAGLPPQSPPPSNA